jgi:hypothetical protein
VRSRNGGAGQCKMPLPRVPQPGPQCPCPTDECGLVRRRRARSRFIGLLPAGGCLRNQSEAAGSFPRWSRIRGRSTSPNRLGLAVAAAIRLGEVPPNRSSCCSTCSRPPCVGTSCTSGRRLRLARPAHWPAGRRRNPQLEAVHVPGAMTGESVPAERAEPQHIGYRTRSAATRSRPGRSPLDPGSAASAQCNSPVRN